MFSYHINDDEYSERKTNYTLAHYIALRDFAAIEAMFANPKYIHLNLNMSLEAKKEQGYQDFSHICFESYKNEARVLYKTEDNTLEMFQYLVSKGLKLKHKGRDYYKDCALHLAVENNYPKVVEFLISQGVDLNPVNHFYATPLSLATYRNCEEIAHLLIDAGADINLFDWKRKTPLYYALSHNNLVLSQKLIHHGSDVNHLLDHWQNFLCEEDVLKHFNMVKLLVDSGIDVFHPNSTGNFRNLLHFCAFEGYAQQFELFLNLGLDINEKTSMHGTTFELLENKPWENTFLAIYEKHCLHQEVTEGLKSNKKVKI
jgi:ankyrin repeat protein